jgi:hypothetical protein
MPHCPFISLLLLLTLPSCAHFPPPTDPQRSASFEPFADTQIDGIPADLFLRQRTAILLNGTVTVSQAAADGPALALSFKPEPGKYLNGTTHAPAIDPRGYFLTAAHCLDEPSLYLVYFDGQNARIATPRVVLKVFDESRHLDYALLHVPAKIPFTFQWSKPDDLLPTHPVLAVGSSTASPLTETLAYATQTCLAGKILATAPSIGVTRIAHDIPLRPGDSGGPLASPSGTLLALNTDVHVSWNGIQTMYALRPEPQAIAQAIEKDAAESHPPPPPIPHTLPDTRSANLVVALW